MFRVLQLREHLNGILANDNLVMLVEVRDGGVGELLPDTVFREDIVHSRKFVRAHVVASYEEIVAEVDRVLVENTASAEAVSDCGCGSGYLIEIFEGEQLLERYGCGHSFSRLCGYG